jgi:hypothetical protein
MHVKHAWIMKKQKSRSVKLRNAKRRLEPNRRKSGRNRPRLKRPRLKSNVGERTKTHELGNVRDRQTKRERKPRKIGDEKKNGLKRERRRRHGVRSNGQEFDPYQVLEVSRGASKEAIKAAYLNLIKQYHPDKVAHLGKELQDHAKTKTQDINRAYKILISS